MSEHKRGIYNTAERKARRRKLRNFLTAAEAVLWTYLKKAQLDGKKFRRQASIGPYIVDFFCPKCRVIVELDGARHFGPTAGEYDDRRTKYLEERGLKVIRFENKRIKKDVKSVLEEIRESLGGKSHPE